MLKKQTHITAFLSLLVCLTLSLSSFHSHKHFEWGQHSHSDKTELPASIDIDSNVCPVCGYLFSADAPVVTVVEIVPREFAFVPVSNNVICLSEDPSINQKRAPPFQV